MRRAYDTINYYISFRSFSLTLCFFKSSQASEEGCLSIPNVRENINRKSEIKIKYFDENFILHQEVFSGIVARVIQHEYDHVEGVLFTDKVSPLKKKLIKGKLNSIMTGKVSADYVMNFYKK